MNEATSNFNTVWVAGTPRTGSMWTANIVREIFKLTGYKVFPEKQYQDPKDFMKTYIYRSIPEKSLSNKYVYKVHKPLKLDLPRSKYITNIRNPYEICASFYQFMKCDLKKAIKVALKHIDVINYYKQIPKENLLIIRHENIETNEIRTVKEIASFVEINLTEKNAELVSNKFSKEQVKQIIKKCETNIKKRIKEMGTVSDNELVRISPSYTRAFDLDTGFQSGHLAKYSSSKWRNIFSKLDIEKIINSIDDSAIKLGYKSEKKRKE